MEVVMKLVNWFEPERFVTEKISRELKKVGEKSYKPAKPRKDAEGLVVLKEEENKYEGKRKIN